MPVHRDRPAGPAPGAVVAGHAPAGASVAVAAPAAPRGRSPAHQPSLVAIDPMVAAGGGGQAGTRWVREPGRFRGGADPRRAVNRPMPASPGPSRHARGAVVTCAMPAALRDAGTSRQPMLLAAALAWVPPRPGPGFRDPAVADTVRSRWPVAPPWRPVRCGHGCRPAGCGRRGPIGAGSRCRSESGRGGRARCAWPRGWMRPACRGPR